VKRWSTFEKWVVALALVCVVLAILGGNRADYWTGVIWSLGSLAMMAWVLTVPLALFVIGVRTWAFWRARQGRQ
jgi:hypothetical protein